MTPVPWSLAEPPDGFFDDPFPFYRQLRVDAPIARAADGSVLLSRHADLSAVYRDAVSFSSDKRVEFAPKYGDGPLFGHHTTSLVFNDDPYHGRVRRRLVGALTPRALAALAEALGPYCEALLDRFAASGGGDAVEGYAAAVPVRVIGAANRDPAAFADAETFDVRRAPNRHLAFGAGPHQCAGLSLARIEARIAIAAWLRRFPEFGLAGHPHWQHRVRFRGLTALDVAL